MEGEKGRAMAMAVKFVAFVVFVGWVMIWILAPTETYRHKLKPKLKAGTISTYLGTQGANILIYTFPILFLSILGCVYAHLEKGRTPRRKSSGIWKRPLIVKGPFGIVSHMEMAFFLMFLLLVIWCFFTYLRGGFSKINSDSAAKSGEKVWEAKLESASLCLGLAGNMCLAFLFFPVTRSSSLLRLTGLTSESGIRYHIWVGHIMMALFTMHGLFYIIYWILTRNTSEIMKWSSVGESNLAGELSLLFGLVLWATTHPKIRRKMFELFFYTHQLYFLFLLFFLFHVGISCFCLILPGVFLFMIDRYLRFLQSRRMAKLISARILPGKIVELNFAKQPGFEYTAASTVFLNVPSISKLQWHPFTVCSSSNLEPESLSVIIRKEGSWTEKLYQMLSSPSLFHPIHFSVEGPYGATSNNFQRYESLVLISGGSGITPFISIIRELIYNTTKSPEKPSPKLHLICSFKTSSDLSILNLLLPCTNLEDDISHVHLRIDAFVTREKVPDEDWKKHVRTITFTSSPNTTTPISPILGPNSSLWLAVVIATSFLAYLLLLGLINRYYIYPIDGNTDEVYSYSAKSMLNLLMMCMAIGGVAGVAVWRGTRSLLVESKGFRVANTSSPTNYWEAHMGREIESLPWKAVLDNVMVQYGARPDLKKMIMEHKELNTGVFVSGPTTMQCEVAKICSRGLMDNLNFMSFSFNW